MSEQLGEAVLTLRTDSSALDTGLASVKTGIEGFGASLGDIAKNPMGALQGGIDSIVTKLGPMGVGMLGIGTAAFSAGTAIFNFGKAAADEMEHLENLSTQTGLSTQTLQALKIMADEAGLSGLDLGRTIGMLNAQLGQGKGDFVNALKEMNITLTDTATGTPKDAVTLLDEVRTQLLNIKDPTERAQAAQDALGGRLRDLIPALLNSKTSWAEMITEISGSSAVYDEITKIKLKAFDDALDSVSRKFTEIETGAKSAVGGLFGTMSTWTGFKSLIGNIADQMGKGGPGVVGLGAALAATDAELLVQRENTKKVATELTNAKPGVTSFAFSEESLAEQAKWAAEDIKKQHEETKKLREQTDLALTPADTLAEKIKKQIDLGFSQHSIVTLYKDELVTAAAKQVTLTGDVSDSTAKFLEMALEMGSTKLASETLAGTTTTGLGLLEGKLSNVGSELTSMAGKIGEMPTTFNKNNVYAIIGEESDKLGLKLEGISKKDGQFDKIINKSNEFGNQVSTTLTNLTQKLGETIFGSGDEGGWVGTFKKFGASALSALMEGLFDPLISKLTAVGSAIINWATGLITGKNGVGSLLDSITGAWNGTGTGGKPGAGTTPGGGTPGAPGPKTFNAGNLAAYGIAAGVGVAGGFLAGSANDWAKAGGYTLTGLSTGMGIAGASAGAGASTLGAMGAFLTNPWTIAAVGAVFAGLGLAKWASGPDSYDALSKEIKRDLGVDVSDKQIKAFLDGVGISEEMAWAHRMEIEQSPLFMAWMLQQGKKPHTKVEAFKNPLAWGAINDQWGPYDELYANWLGNELKVRDIPWANMLIPNGTYPDDESKIPSYRTGTAFVPETGLALLHKGEAVIPAAVSRENCSGITINIQNAYGAEGIQAVVERAINMALDRGGLRRLARA